MKFSREQESAADIIGLEVIVNAYGHAGGATESFKMLSKLHGEKSVTAFLESHPHPEDRIKELESLIKERQYPIKNTVPLKLSIKR